MNAATLSDISSGRPQTPDTTEATTASISALFMAILASSSRANGGLGCAEVPCARARLGASAGTRERRTTHVHVLVDSTKSRWLLNVLPLFMRHAASGDKEDDSTSQQTAPHRFETGPQRRSLPTPRADHCAASLRTLDALSSSADTRSFRTRAKVAHTARYRLGLPQGARGQSTTVD